MKKQIVAFLMLVPIVGFAQKDSPTAINLFAVKGKWIAISPADQMAYKAVVQIDCFKDDGYCNEAAASVVLGKPDIFEEQYKIISWDNNGIVAENDDAQCLSNKLIFNFRDRSVVGIDAPKTLPKEIEKICKIFDQTNIYILVKPSE